MMITGVCITSEYSVTVGIIQETSEAAGTVRTVRMSIGVPIIYDHTVWNRREDHSE